MARIFRNTTSQKHLHLLPLIGVVVMSARVFGQPAPSRSDELCRAIQSAAIENSRKFEALKPGACRVNLDTGYDLFVDYDERSLHLAIGVNVGLLNGDASAFWLHLSAFDNFVYSAMGTKPQAVFDNLSKLAKAFALRASQGELHPGMFFDGKTDRAHLTIGGSASGEVVVLGASADVGDIDRMKRTRGHKIGDEVPTWRRILGLSLQVFGAGAQGYASAYGGPSTPQWQSQPVYNAPKTCYTNFIGRAAFTNCY